MVFYLYYDKTPITVGNFVALSEGTREFTSMKTGKKEKAKKELEIAKRLFDEQGREADAKKTEELLSSLKV